MLRKGKGGEEDRYCDGRIALSETWKEHEKNGEKEQLLEGTGEC